jgi:hypothetical protein
MALGVTILNTVPLSLARLTELPLLVPETVNTLPALRLARVICSSLALAASPSEMAKPVRVGRVSASVADPLTVAVPPSSVDAVTAKLPLTVFRAVMSASVRV